MPVDTADTRNSTGRMALFHSGKPSHTPSKQPVYTATHKPMTMPAMSSHCGTVFFKRSISSAMRASTTNAARNTTPQVMTDPKLVSSSAKRSGWVNPAWASNMSRHRPMTTTTGAMMRPMRISRVHSG